MKIRNAMLLEIRGCNYNNKSKTIFAAGENTIIYQNINLKKGIRNRSRSSARMSRTPVTPLHSTKSTHFACTLRPVHPINLLCLNNVSAKLSKYCSAIELYLIPDGRIRKFKWKSENDIKYYFYYYHAYRISNVILKGYHKF